MRLGFGFVFEGGCPALRAAAAAGLGTGPPDPSVPLTPDAWIARFTDLTLLERPGTVWRYDVAYDYWASCSPAPAGARSGSCCANSCSIRWAWPTPPSAHRPCYAVDESALVLFDDAWPRQ